MFERWKQRVFSLSLTSWILIALVAGIVLGALAPDFALSIRPFRQLFLNAVKCIIAPLIFASIVCGINSSGSTKALGRVGLLAMIWFEIASTVALLVGLVFVNWFRPGSGLQIGKVENIEASTSQLSFAHFIEHLLPPNFAEAVVKGDVLQIVLFSCIFGVACLIAGEAGKPVLKLCQSLNTVMFKFTEIVMKMAPIGVGAAMAGSVAEHGFAVLLPMAKLIGTLYLALFVFSILVLLPALKFARIRVLEFLKELRPSLALAFATTSSESAFPGALRSLEKIGVPERIASFVLPLGYSFNLDGSTLYLAIASVFIAQAAGIDLPIHSQISMLLLLMVTSKGVAAVPRATVVVLSATLATFGLPLEGIALILGVDEFMDMARTSVNLLGNCVATVVVSRLESEALNPEFQYKA